MALSAAFVRKQLNRLKPMILSTSLEIARAGQDAMGELMYVPHRKSVRVEAQTWTGGNGLPSVGEWILPRDQTSDGAIIYLHGGGYTCGGLEYAKGFGTLLADECGIRVFCAAYRLAPEHPYPAALEDALEAYRLLLRSGIPSDQIVLCGESAGGGLCYALSLKLRALRLPAPAGILAISPWTDLTMSSPSFEKNRDADPSMSKERLTMFAQCYTSDPTDPLVSPLFADLRGLPPSLIFVGGDEVMLDDSVRMHEALRQAGCVSHLTVTPHMWHGYVLYATKEHHAGDFAKIRSFFKRVLPPARKLRWMKLDNAAKIFPASRRRNWINVFRLSATLSEAVDPQILQSALDVTVRRFPSVAVRLRRGAFWYYLEEIRHAPAVREDCEMPLQRMPLDDIRNCAIRVLYYQNRIAVEFFHAVTDGNGGLIFLKTLVAEYLSQRYHIAIPAEKGVYDRLEEPKEAEIEDSFLRYSGDYAASRRGETAYHIHDEPEPDHFLHLTCGMIPVKDVLSIAKSYNVSLTVLLTAVMIQSVLELQNRTVHSVKHQKPVKVSLPVNLRQLFPSITMRNFILVTNVGVDPRKGEYSFEEILKIVKHQMGLEVNRQHMRAEITVNVKDEQNPALKIVPLFLKNLVMRIVFDIVGEARSSLALSNLGAAKIPSEMIPYVKRLDFIIGPQSCSPYNCGVISYGDTLYINLVRNTVHPVLEHAFFTRLVQMGLPVTIESNQREEEEM